MSNIQTGAERMPHDLSHLGFLAGQIGRLITISTTPVIAGDSFEMDAVGALRLSPLRVAKYVNKKSDMDLAAKGLGAKEWNNSLKTKLSLLPKKLFRIRMSRNFGMK